MCIQLATNQPCIVLAHLFTSLVCMLHLDMKYICTPLATMAMDIISRGNKCIYIYSCYAFAVWSLLTMFMYMPWYITAQREGSRNFVRSRKQPVKLAWLARMVPQVLILKMWQFFLCLFLFSHPCAIVAAGIKQGTVFDGYPVQYCGYSSSCKVL